MKNSTPIPEELKRLVIDEATKILQYATLEERTRLKANALTPESIFYCVYGQMTGHCHCPRSLELLNQCTLPYSGQLDYPEFAPVYNDLEFEVNTEGFRDPRRADFSPIGVYICQPKAKNAVLIAFLRGERETLTVDDL